MNDSTRRVDRRYGVEAQGALTTDLDHWLEVAALYRGDYALDAGSADGYSRRGTGSAYSLLGAAGTSKDRLPTND